MLTEEAGEERGRQPGAELLNLREDCPDPHLPAAATTTATVPPCALDGLAEA